MRLLVKHCVVKQLSSLFFLIWKLCVVVWEWILISKSVTGIAEGPTPLPLPLVNIFKMKEITER